MKLIKILDGIDYEIIKGNLDIIINDIKYDSRCVSDKDLFVALVGVDVDGHDYIDQAIDNGASAIIICRDIDIDRDVTVVKIKDTRLELSVLSANLFGHPSDKLTTIAITGTKGKTSVSWMIKEILEKAGFNVGVIGTVGTYINGRLYQHKNTTPEAYLVQKYMKMMIDNHVSYLIMEASSQALKVGRINNIIFDYGIYTNLSLDHVGPREHSSFDDYKYSKSLLFRQCKTGIFNIDDKYYKDMIKNCTCDIVTYGKDADLSCNSFKSINDDTFLGMEFDTIYNNIKNTYRVSAPGEFSIYNAMSAITLCKLLNIDNKYIKEGLSKFKVSGRCEIFNIKNRFKVIIDFAHNKISMESIINTMKNYNHNRIITIFGCGGGRSSDRRLELGIVSGKLSDLSIITMDNPRNDDIDEINRDIEDGIKEVDGSYLIIQDRRDAIKYAIENAEDGDIILILGKGHEDYQEIKGVRYPFDERVIIREIINELSPSDKERLGII